jgi:hypothetical protein
VAAVYPYFPDMTEEKTPERGAPGFFVFPDEYVTR